MRKLLLSLICFLTFFNGVYQSNNSGTHLFDSDEVVIEIDSARTSENNLQIDWAISGVENIDQVILSVREITPDGLLNEPLEKIDYSGKSSGKETISWDGSVNLSLIVKILSTNYSKYSGPDCDSIYCYKDITTEITSEEYIINKIPDLPPVSTTIELESNPEVEIEEPPVVDNSTNITFTNELITTIPLFSDIDFSDQAKNTFAFLITSGIIFLFYGVLLAQEWFNRIIAHYRVRWTSRKSKLKEKTWAFFSNTFVHQSPTNSLVAWNKLSRNSQVAFARMYLITIPTSLVLHDKLICSINQDKNVYCKH